MAIIRASVMGAGSTVHQKQEDGSLRSRVRGIYEGIMEAPEDLSAPQTADYAPGSMLYCLGSKKLYIKNSREQWEEVS